MLVTEIRRRLADEADPVRAATSRSYLKSSLPCLGVRVPEVRRIARECEQASPLLDERALRTAVRTLWDEAAFREERFAASELLGTQRARRDPPADRIELLQDLIVDGAWWDHVDGLSRRVGELLLAHPEVIRPRLLSWATGPDRWLRRSSIICQLGLRQRTDRRLLSDAIDASAAESDFFLRKGIGWALRDYARTDPGWVQAFIDSRTLSPLSVREAMKHL